MKNLSVLICTAAVCCIWILGFAEAQDRCIFSRLDVLECATNARTQLPSENELGIFRTRIFNSQSGVLRCIYRDPNRFPNAEVLKPIDTLGSPNLRLIFSPGFIIEEGYANAMLVTYNIQCPAGRLAFFNLTLLDLQPADCMDRCQDYIQVNRGEFGTTESCGTEPQDNMFQLEQGSFTVTFRTSESTQGTGFEIYVICFDRQELDLPGCTRVEDDSTMNTTARNVESRKKRDLEEFHNRWRRRLKRGAPGIQFQQLTIVHGDTVMFRDGFLRVFNSSRDLTASFRILVLHTFDNESNLDAFVREAAAVNQSTGERNFIQFIGPGPMTVIGREAYLQLFAIDPRGIIPNPAEMIVLDELTSELFEALSAENDTNVTNPNPPTESIPDVILDIFGRRKRGGPIPDDEVPTVAQVSDFISEDAIRQAILNENACNPVVRTTAEITLQIATTENATRVEEIRRLLETPSTLDLDCSVLESPNEETITVICAVEDEPVSVGICSIDNQQQFTCSFPFNTTTMDLTPGNHSITVSVTQNGLSGQDTVPFVVNQLSCRSNSSTSGESVVNEVTCTLNGNPLTQANCSFDSAAPEPCTLPFIVSTGGIITVSVTVDGQRLEALVLLQFGEK